MRVLHFVDTFSNLSETFIYDQILELERRAGGQSVVTHHRLHPEERPFARVHLVPPLRRWSAKRLWYRALAGAPRRPRRNDLQLRLERVARTVNPDVIHAHFGTAGVIVAPVAEALGVPLVVSFHGFDASALLIRSDWRAHLEALFAGDGTMVVVSDAMRRRLVGAGARPECVRVVHVGKRLADYPFTPSRRVRRFLSVGRMTEKKGHLDTLAAFAALPPTCAGWRLDVVGDGHVLGACERFVEVSGLGDRVRLWGLQHHAVVQRLLAEADAFVLSSKTAPDGDEEGVPTVLMEAQAAGLPVVSTRHSGIPEAIPEANHRLLVGEGDVRGIADCLAWLMARSEDEIAAIARRGRAHVEREFDLEKETTNLLDVYAKACGPDRPTRG